MQTFRSIRNSLKDLRIDPNKPIIFHADFSSLDEVQGGSETVLGALLTVSNMVMSPAFTYRTMIIPETGPEDNGLVYGANNESNQKAEFFKMDIPVDSVIGVLAEILRQHPKSDGRSMHPILSFTGINVSPALEKQSLADPLAPIEWLYQQNGYVVLIGTDHTVNTTIHYAEKLAGRKLFTRWALTPSGVVECPGLPGCPKGFNQAEPVLRDITREVLIGNARIRSLPIKPMIAKLLNILQEDPLALLCENPDCRLCNAVRTTNSVSPSQNSPNEEEE